MRQLIKLPKAEVGCLEMISDYIAAFYLSRIHIQIFSGSDALQIKYGTQASRYRTAKKPLVPQAKRNKIKMGIEHGA